MSERAHTSEALWLKPKQITEIYGVGRSTLYTWIQQGLIKSTTTRVSKHQKYGSRLVNRASLEELLERNATGGATN
jgi:predicted site-specific integrase-resolvase